MVDRWSRLTGDPARLLTLVLVVAGFVLLAGAFLGANRSEFLVSDLAYLGTGGLGGVACLGVAGAVAAASRSARRCAELDRLEAVLANPGPADPGPAER